MAATRAGDDGVIQMDPISPLSAAIIDLGHTLGEFSTHPLHSCNFLSCSAHVVPRSNLC
jgi:hypothetical protein